MKKIKTLVHKDPIDTYLIRFRMGIKARFNTTYPAAYILNQIYSIGYTSNTTFLPIAAMKISF